MGERLQRLRQAAGMSQPQLATAAQVPVASIRNWEQDRRHPRLDAALRVANALGISLDELASAADPEPPPARPRRGKGRSEL